MAKTPNPPKKMAKVAKKAATPNSAMKKAGPKQVQKGIVNVINANKFKPVANPAKKSTYRKLDTVLRSAKASAGKTGNARAEARAEGGLRGLSILRQDAAAARRGERPVATGSYKGRKGTTPIPPTKKSKSPDAKKLYKAPNKVNPLTSIGGYSGMNFAGTKKFSVSPIKSTGAMKRKGK